jgi:hypothetical protein
VDFTANTYNPHDPQACLTSLFRDKASSLACPVGKILPNISKKNRKKYRKNNNIVQNRILHSIVKELSTNQDKQITLYDRNTIFSKPICSAAVQLDILYSFLNTN